MVIINEKCFDIKKICQSGQCFRMFSLDENTYYVIAFDKYLKMEQKGKEVIFYCSKTEYQMVWRKYFDLDRNYQKIEKAVREIDPYMKQAVMHASGIRILHQDLWEMILSFIISQQSNIKRIQKSIELLSYKYGSQKTSENGTVYYCFPTAKELENVTEQELREDNLGYRAPYIVDTVHRVMKGELDLDLLKKMDYIKSKEALMRCHGIGKKVADCICLFGLHHLEAFPIDTHINHVLADHYKEGFPINPYNSILGIIQQYMFYEDLYYKTAK